MATYIEFVSRLIYGTGAEAEITPNHRDWVSAQNILTTGSDPTGSAWLTHSLDNMLTPFEAWNAGEGLPPALPGGA